MLTGSLLVLLESLWKAEKGTSFSEQTQHHIRMHSWEVGPKQIFVPPVGPWARHFCLVNNLYIWIQRPWRLRLRCKGLMEGKGQRLHFSLRNEHVQDLQAWERVSFTRGPALGSVWLEWGGIGGTEERWGWEDWQRVFIIYSLSRYLYQV